MNAYSKGRNNNQQRQEVVRVMPQPEGMNLPAEQWTLLTDVIWPGAKTAGAIKLAFDYCVARKLDPFKRPVHIVPMYNSRLKAQVETVWPGIADLETTAARTGEWAGMDEPRWGEMIEREFVQQQEGQDEFGQPQSSQKIIKVRFPEWCSVTVYRMVHGQPRAFSEPVYWEETYATLNRWTDVPNEMWRKRPRGQLHKCAKAAAIRAAFPEETGHDYTHEEMEGKSIDGGGVVIPGTATFQDDEGVSQAALMAPEARLNTLEDALAKAAGLDKVPAEAGSSVVYPQKEQEAASRASIKTLDPKKYPPGETIDDAAKRVAGDQAKYGVAEGERSLVGDSPEPPAHLSDAPPAGDFPGDLPSAPQPSEEPASPPEEPKKARSFGDWLSGIDRELAAAGNIATIGFIERRQDVTDVLAKVADKPKLLAAFKERVDFHVARLEGGQ